MEAALRHPFVIDPILKGSGVIVFCEFLQSVHLLFEFASERKNALNAACYVQGE
jgi:hypothetical protein